MQARTFRANLGTWLCAISSIVYCLALLDHGLLKLRSASKLSDEAQVGATMLGYLFLIIALLAAALSVLYFLRIFKTRITITAERLTYQSLGAPRSFNLTGATLLRQPLPRNGDWILETPDQPPFNLSQTDCKSKALIAHLQSLVPTATSPCESERGRTA